MHNLPDFIITWCDITKYSDANWKQKFIPVSSLLIKIQRQQYFTVVSRSRAWNLSSCVAADRSNASCFFSSISTAANESCKTTHHCYDISYTKAVQRITGISFINNNQAIVFSKKLPAYWRQVHQDFCTVWSAYIRTLLKVLQLPEK